MQPGLEHAAYIMAVTGIPATGGYAALVAYTTSQTLPDPLPLGILRFDEQAAKRMGHKKPFLLNPGRIAYVPIDAAYFPYLNRPGHGVIGHASKSTQAAITEATKSFLKRPEAIERSGPLWPKPR